MQSSGRSARSVHGATLTMRTMRSQLSRGVSPRDARWVSNIDPLHVLRIRQLAVPIVLHGG